MIRSIAAVIPGLQLPQQGKTAVELREQTEEAQGVERRSANGASEGSADSAPAETAALTVESEVPGMGMN